MTFTEKLHGPIKPHGLNLNDNKIRWGDNDLLVIGHYRVSFKFKYKLVATY